MKILALNSLRGERFLQESCGPDSSQTKKKTKTITIVSVTNIQKKVFDGLFTSRPCVCLTSCFCSNVKALTHRLRASESFER